MKYKHLYIKSFKLFSHYRTWHHLELSVMYQLLTSNIMSQFTEFDHENLSKDSLYNHNSTVTTWHNIIVNLIKQVVSTVDPNIRLGDSLDIRPYVKIKIIPGGKIEDNKYIDGLVFRKNVCHKKMLRYSKNPFIQPKILLFAGGIEYHFQRQNSSLFSTSIDGNSSTYISSNNQVNGMNIKFSSIDMLLEQETKYIELLIDKFMSLKPDIIIVAKSVSRQAQEIITERYSNIILLQNVKVQVLDQLSRCTGAVIILPQALDHMIQQYGRNCLGVCESFYLDMIHDDPEKQSYMKDMDIHLHPYANMSSNNNNNTEPQHITTTANNNNNNNNNNSSFNSPYNKAICTLHTRASTYAYFTGCPPDRGCTIILRGASRVILEEIKNIFQFALAIAYHLRLEGGYYIDLQITPKLLHTTTSRMNTDNRTVSTEPLMLINSIINPSNGVLSSVLYEPHDFYTFQQQQEQMLNNNTANIKTHADKNYSYQELMLYNILVRLDAYGLLSSSLDCHFKLPYVNAIRGLITNRIQYKSNWRYFTSVMDADDHRINNPTSTTNEELASEMSNNNNKSNNVPPFSVSSSSSVRERVGGGQGVLNDELSKFNFYDIHQHLYVISILRDIYGHSKGKADLKCLSYYTAESDLTLGAFLMDSCFQLCKRLNPNLIGRSTTTNASTTTGNAMLATAIITNNNNSLNVNNPMANIAASSTTLSSLLDHTISFLHRDSRLDIKIQKRSTEEDPTNLPIPLTQANIIDKDENINTYTRHYYPMSLSIYCKECATIVKQDKYISEDLWKMSYGKFMELLFYYDNNEICHTNTNTGTNTNMSSSVMDSNSHGINSAFSIDGLDSSKNTMDGHSTSIPAASVFDNIFPAMNHDFASSGTNNNIKNKTNRSDCCHCTHTLKYSQILSFKCDIYEARMSLHPIHPYSIHIREQMEPPLLFIQRDTAMVLTQFITQSIDIIDQFLNSLLTLEATYYSLLASSTNNTSNPTTMNVNNTSSMLSSLLPCLFKSTTNPLATTTATTAAVATTTMTAGMSHNNEDLAPRQTLYTNRDISLAVAEVTNNNSNTNAIQALLMDDDNNINNNTNTNTDPLLSIPVSEQYLYVLLQDLELLEYKISSTMYSIMLVIQNIFQSFDSSAIQDLTTTEPHLMFINYLQYKLEKISSSSSSSSSSSAAAFTMDNNTKTAATTGGISSSTSLLSMNTIVNETQTPCNNNTNTMITPATNTSNLFNFDTNTNINSALSVTPLPVTPLRRFSTLGPSESISTPYTAGTPVPGPEIIETEALLHHLSTTIQKLRNDAYSNAYILPIPMLINHTNTNANVNNVSNMMQIPPEQDEYTQHLYSLSAPHSPSQNNSPMKPSMMMNTMNNITTIPTVNNNTAAGAAGGSQNIYPMNYTTHSMFLQSQQPHLQSQAEFKTTSSLPTAAVLPATTVIGDEDITKTLNNYDYSYNPLMLKKILYKHSKQWNDQIQSLYEFADMLQHIANTDPSTSSNTQYRTTRANSTAVVTSLGLGMGKGIGSNHHNSYLSTKLSIQTALIPILTRVTNAHEIIQDFSTLAATTTIPNTDTAAYVENPGISESHSFPTSYPPTTSRTTSPPLPLVVPTLPSLERIGIPSLLTHKQRIIPTTNTLMTASSPIITRPSSPVPPSAINNLTASFESTLSNNISKSNYSYNPNTIHTDSNSTNANNNTSKNNRFTIKAISQFMETAMGRDTTSTSNNNYYNNNPYSYPLKLKSTTAGYNSLLQGRILMQPGRNNEIFAVHDDEMSTIIAYSLASSEYYYQLQNFYRMDFDYFLMEDDYDVALSNEDYLKSQFNDPSNNNNALSDINNNNDDEQPIPIVLDRLVLRNKEKTKSEFLLKTYSSSSSSSLVPTNDIPTTNNNSNDNTIPSTTNTDGDEDESFNTTKPKSATSSNNDKIINKSGYRQIALTSSKHDYISKTSGSDSYTAISNTTILPDHHNTTTSHVSPSSSSIQSSGSERTNTNPPSTGSTSHKASIILPEYTSTEREHIPTRLLSTIVSNKDISTNNNTNNNDTNTSKNEINTMNEEQLSSVPDNANNKEETSDANPAITNNATSYNFTTSNNDNSPRTSSSSHSSTGRRSSKAAREEYNIANSRERQMLSQSK